VTAEALRVGFLFSEVSDLANGPGARGPAPLENPGLCQIPAYVSPAASNRAPPTSNRFLPPSVSKRAGALNSAGPCSAMAGVRPLGGRIHGGARVLDASGGAGRTGFRGSLSYLRNPLVWPRSPHCSPLQRAAPSSAAERQNRRPENRINVWISEGRWPSGWPPGGVRTFSARPVAWRGPRCAPRKTLAADRGSSFGGGGVGGGTGSIDAARKPARRLAWTSIQQAGMIALRRRRAGGAGWKSLLRWDDRSCESFSDSAEPSPHGPRAQRSPCNDWDKPVG